MAQNLLTVLKRFQSCKKCGKHIRTFVGDIPGLSESVGNMLEHLESIENDVEHLKSSENVSKHLENIEAIAEHSESSENCSDNGMKLKSSCNFWKIVWMKQDSQKMQPTGENTQ